jgi:hypothetical protein
LSWPLVTHTHTHTHTHPLLSPCSIPRAAVDAFMRMQDIEGSSDDEEIKDGGCVPMARAVVLRVVAPQAPHEGYSRRFCVVGVELEILVTPSPLPPPHTPPRGSSTRPEDGGLPPIQESESKAVEITIPPPEDLPSEPPSLTSPARWVGCRCVRVEGCFRLLLLQAGVCEVFVL